jgi:protocatechuate 3,4-dioxygenase beta subunit
MMVAIIEDHTMDRASRFVSRRAICLGGGAVVGCMVSFPLRAAGEIQPLARASHFPQMPTGFVGVTPCGSLHPPGNIASSGRIASGSEPGQPIEISGIVFLPDRATPAEGITIFAYHTDAAGYYNKPNNPFNPRLYGWVRTGKDGRYTFRTIKPGPYPDLSTPAHIHVSLFGPGYPEYWVDDYWFEGDPRINPQQIALLTGRGGGGETLQMSQGNDGMVHGSRNFVLEHVKVSGDCRLL